ncbi:hypothetical protein JW879_06690 [candidate division WOR-3 bacterium]|nr:hypothetical protein [candidate division WOR-3 bacterium]
MKDKLSFKIILIFFAFFILSGCSEEGGNIFNEILSKTVKSFSPEKNKAPTGKAEIFNLITSANDEKSEEEIDSAMIDSLENIGEALNWVRAFYTDRGNRDPFTPLLTGSEGQEAKLNVDLAELSGIIWVKDKYLAIVKEGNRGFVLKEGDMVVGGKVLNVTDSSISFILRKFGEQTKVTLSLKKQER